MELFSVGGLPNCPPSEAEAEIYNVFPSMRQRPSYAGRFYLPCAVEFASTFVHIGGCLAGSHTKMRSTLNRFLTG